MVDLSDLTKASMLASEKRSLQTALDVLGREGVILSMSVGPKPPESELEMPFMGSGIQVSTASITYPPQMITSITQQFQQRLATVTAELTALGVTGTDAPPAAAQQAGPARRRA